MNINDFVNLDFGANTERVFSTPRHLDAPLIADHLLNDIHNAFGTHRVEARVFHLRKMIGLVRDDLFDDDLATKLRHDRATYEHYIKPIAPSEIIRVATLTQASVHLHAVATNVALAMTHSVTNVLAERGIATDVSFELGGDTLNLFQREMTLVAPQSRLVSMRAEGDSSVVIDQLATPFGTHIVLSDAYAILVDARSGSMRVMTYDMYLSILDIARVRSRAILACDLLYSGSEMKHRIFAQWEWQSAWIDEYENEGFAIAKQTEALNKTRLGWESDPETRAGGAYERMWDKIFDKLYKLTKNARRARARIAEARSEYENYVASASIPEIAELFGLQKCIGYPFIDSVRGGLSAAHEARQQIEIRISDALALRNEWRSMFLEGYLAKEKKWPRVAFGASASTTQLHKWYTAGYTNITANEIDPHEWEHVVFLKNFEYDEFDNYLDLMDDKALSYNRSEADAYWDASIKANSDRRLLLEIMSREHFVYRVILEKVDNGIIPYDWKIVCIYPKEKELKADARMFCMMVMEMRTIFNGSEANIARHIFPYIAPQTMTRSKDEIHRLFHKFTQPRETDTELHLFLECDLSRWNLRWRSRVVDLVGHDLNMLFGLRNVFTAAHTFFAESVVMVRTPRLRPRGVDEREPTDSELLYRRWLGGFEGIQQKLWTLCTYAMIQRALREEQVSYLLIGQGDNQILSIVAARDTFNTLAQQYNDLNDRVTSKLAHYCAAVGQELKPEECLHSRTVITYSKEVWVRGVMYPLSIKFFSRISARTNEEVPTLCAEIAGLHAAGVAAADACFRPLQVYIGVCFLHALEIQLRCAENHPCFSNVGSVTHRRLRKLTVNDICRTLIWPAACGGLPISHLWNYIHRGTADPLSEQLAVFFRFCRASSVFAPLYAYYVSERFLTTPRDATALILAPYSLPLRVIDTARSRISTLIRRYVNNVARNTDFKSLLDAKQREAGNALLLELSSMRPMYPLVAREVYDNSSSAEVEKLEKMFIMTQTVQKAARRAQVSVRDLINATSGTEFVERIRCCFECAESAAVLTMPLHAFIGEPARLRRKWENVCAPVQGVTSTASAWFDIAISSEPSKDSGVKLLVMPTVDPLQTIGEFEPYLGARTRIERSSYGYRLVGDSRSVTALKRLRILANLPGTGPHFRAMVQRVAETRGNVTEQLSILTGGVSSSRFDHRYHARDDERGSYVVGPYNYSTHCILYTEEIDGITGSLNDYPFMFQEYFTDLIGSAIALQSPRAPQMCYAEFTIVLSASDFTPLPILAIDTNGEHVHAISRHTSRSRLVYDPMVWRYDLIGSVARRNVVVAVEVDQVSDLELVHAAIRSSISPYLPTHFASTEVFDAAMTKEHPFAFDLPTVRNVGGMAILAIAVGVICNAVAERYLVELALDVSVGRRELYIRRYSTFVARRLAPLLENVQLIDDELVTRTHVHVATLRDDNTANAVKRIAFMIAAYTRKELRKLSLNSYERYIFASDHGSTASHLHLAAVARAIISSVENGTPSMYAIRAAKNVLFADVITEHAEGNRLGKIQRFALALRGESCWSAHSKKLLDYVIGGSLITLVNGDHQVAIRIARSLIPPVYQPITVSTERSTALIVTPYTTHTMTPVQTAAFSFCTQLTLANAWMWNTLPLIASTSYWLWLEVLRCAADRPVVLVGVGNAFAARAALENGCTRVIGVDRVANYDLKKVRGNAPPRALLQHMLRDRFQWDAATFNVDDDTRQTFPLDAAYSRVSSDALIIFDIQPFPTLRQLRNMIATAGVERELIFRRMTNVLEWRFELQRVSQSFAIRAIRIFRSGDAVQLFVRTHTHRALVMHTEPLRFQTITERFCVERVMLTRTTQASLVAGTLGRIAIEFGGRVVDETQRRDLLTTLRNLVGRRLTSDTYVEWTRTLHHMWLLEWWVERDLSVQRLQDAWASTQTTVIRSDNLPMLIEVSITFRAAIRRYAPLLLALRFHGFI